MGVLFFWHAKQNSGHYEKLAKTTAKSVTVTDNGYAHPIKTKYFKPENGLCAPKIKKYLSHIPTNISY